MSDPFEQRVRRIMSGEARGAGATSARAAMSAAEPVYSALTGLRNRLFDRGTLRGRQLARPVVSVGNLTTGGTGKTPAVQWLCRRLLADARRPAILTRGYRREHADAASDEELLLRESLPAVPVIADPDRFAAGTAAIARDATLDVFVLDDGFQHRKLARDCDVVLIDATNPFGYGHVLPRGMLREPIAGLARAHLVILTRVDGRDTTAIEREVRRHHPTVPIVRSDHRLGPARDVDGVEQPLAGRRVFAFSGIGNPAEFERALAAAGATVIGARRFADHHAYATSDVESLRAAARAAGAEAMLTTEKDWVKVRTLDPAGAAVPTWRIGVDLAFVGDGEAVAWQTIAALAPLVPSAPYPSERT